MWSCLAQLAPRLSGYLQKIAQSSRAAAVGPGAWWPRALPSCYSYDASDEPSLPSATTRPPTELAIAAMTRLKQCGLRRSARLLLTLGVGASVGCAWAPRQAVHYSGSEHEAYVSALELKSVPSVPVGYDVIGRLEAKCTQWQPGTPLDALWLSDLDCTTERLERVLAEKAAAVGGEILVGRRCGSKSGRWSNQPSGERSVLSCRAQVARPGRELRQKQPLKTATIEAPSALAAGAHEARWLDDPTGAQAWRIKVSYYPDSALEPSEPVPVGPARPAGAVNELADLPASHQRLGALITDCAAQCSLDAMRASLRVAAGRLGVADVVGVRCVPERTGWHCVGTLAVAELTP